MRNGVNGVAVCGEAVCLTSLRDRLAAEGWRVLDGLEEVPAARLAERAWTRLLEGDVWRGAAEIHTARPLYLRPCDPELKLRRRSG